MRTQSRRRCTLCNDSLTTATLCSGCFILVCESCEADGFKCADCNLSFCKRCMKFYVDGRSICKKCNRRVQDSKRLKDENSMLGDMLREMTVHEVMRGPLYDKNVGDIVLNYVN